MFLAGAVALRAGLAHYDHSVFWPDEIHQSLEQAHRAVFGYGLIPWEFRDGARSWLFPGVIAAVWKLAATLGIDSSLALIAIARLTLVTASVITIWFAAKVAAAAAGPRAAVAVAVILMTFPPSVAFAYRAMSETASAPLVVVGAWYFIKRTPRDLGLSGLALSLACLLRYQNGLIVLVLLGALLLMRRWREAAWFCAAGLGTALFGGLLDWVTWGSPFHSLVAYFDFNLIRSGASSFGVEPFSYYVTALWSSTGPWIAALFFCFLVGAYFQPALGGSVLCYVLAHSVLPHKELRFLVPCLPLFAAVAAVGFEVLLRRLPLPRFISAAAALGLTATFGWKLTQLTYEDMGQYRGTERASLPIWQNEQEPSLLLADAGARSDLCGLEVLGSRAAFTGGYTYLHRDVPLVYGSELCDTASVNYVIGPIGRVLPSAYRLEQQRGDWALFRRDGECIATRLEDDHWLDGARDMGLVRRRAEQASDGSLRFDLQRDAGAFSEGWGHGEMLSCQPSRWSVGKRSAIDFDFVPAGRPYRLNLQAHAYQGAAPQRFSIAVNGHRVHVGQMKSQLDMYTVSIPDGVLRDGPNRIELAFARATRASSNDTRELSALFRAVELVPETDDFTVDVALGDARRHLRRGFFPIEQEGDQFYAWSDGPRSEVEGRLASNRSAYRLITIAEAIPYVARQSARVYVNDILAGTMAFSPRWERHELLLTRNLLQRGVNRIRFEYEATAKPAAIDRTRNDQRELAVRFRSIQLEPVAALQELDFGTASARPFLLEGWSGEERDGERSTVWSNAPKASVLVSLAGIEKPVLRLSAEGYGRALPIAVTVSLNGERVGAFVAPDGWQNIAVPLPTQNAPGDEVISFEFDRTGRPADHNPNSADRRTLALRVDRMWIESEAGDQTITAAVRALRTDMR